MADPKSTQPAIKKILIANRGEIALRILRAAQELGIATVAVYTDVDRAAPHVLYADEACGLGAAPRAYLDKELILDAARLYGVDAIHPGYGFLSENADFAEACENVGIKFIGPPSKAMRILGSKTKARDAADHAEIPRTPGSTRALTSLKEALATASGIGYPVMLKATAGGGGKGMRAVAGEEEMAAAYRDAQSEAERAFGSSEVYLEKLIERPRHIEIQVLADEHGHCVYLGERECSVQRLHQKVIEEAPSAAVDEVLRRQMGEAAVRLALSQGYTNAGTVEFLVDEDRNFYFLEMNTRLQVEHPVTELVTGIDLVHMQILIAQNAPLPWGQNEITIRGHAIECRIYAEDPENNFFPSPGRITRLVRPSGPGLREDSGIYEGWVVPVDYDAMLSKLIAYAPTRQLAIARMVRALEEYCIGGIQTNLALLRRILLDPGFQSAEIDTGYLNRLLAATAAPDPRIESLELTAAVAAALFAADRSGQNAGAANGATLERESCAARTSNWKAHARAEGLS